MERIDDILGYPNLKIYQNPLFFSFSLDSIVLANYSTIRLRDKKIVDFCTGNAVVPLILSQRCDKSIEGIEIQDQLYQLGCNSLALNSLEDRIHLFCCDVKDFCNDASHFNQYDLVLCNPPYFKNYDESTKNISYEKMIARHEVLIDLDSICDSASKILKEHGNISIVHRTDRLMDAIISLKKYHLEPKRIKFVHETINKESFLVLIEAQKMGSSGLKVDKPLILYHEDGTMTDEYALLQKEVRK